MNRLRLFFRNSLEKHPYITNSIIYGSLCVASEFSQQAVTQKILPDVPKPLDFPIIARYAIYGNFIAGPILSGWYRLLDRMLPGTAPKLIVKKLLVDQLFFTPQLLVVFYISMSIMERQQDILEECKRKILPTFKTSCMFWIPAQTINFIFVPSIYRVTYIGFCSYIWINILCMLKREDTNQAN